ncbi:hypothetical protein NOR51B_1452 [Luminiphilus syltensis NOR5-1B]|uniref:Uncharacterized protein n=1 Tax=Luminiphilus syltensis NOR5-1B TaxID=565045 RepID=B8KQH4_9GAMM|nr:hypothetical protein NOR51B_1452 [Luminiphilus syltensis NOR5-1B]
MVSTVLAATTEVASQRFARASASELFYTLLPMELREQPE